MAKEWCRKAIEGTWRMRRVATNVLENDNCHDKWSIWMCLEDGMSTLGAALHFDKMTKPRMKCRSGQ